jgi:hypothetical protein
MSGGSGDSHAVTSTVQGLLQALADSGLPRKELKMFRKDAWNSMCNSAVANEEVAKVAAAMQACKDGAGDDQELLRRRRDLVWKEFCLATEANLERAAKDRSDVMNIP